MNADDRLMEIPGESSRVFDGIILHIDHMDVTLPNGKPAKREIARHIGACAVIPVDAEGNTYLVRQYRATVGKILLEIPAGKLDSPGEDRLLAAQRELREETGYTAAKWEKLCDILTTPGFSDEKIALYLAKDLTLGEVDPDEDEFLNVVKMPVRELAAMCARGEVEDAKTAAAVGILLARGEI